MGRAPYGRSTVDSTTTNATHPNLNTAADLLFQRDTRNFNNTPKTTCRQPQAPDRFWKWLRLFCSFAIVDAWDVLLQILDVSQAHPHCKEIRDNVCLEALKDNLVCIRHSACDSGDAGVGHVTQDKPSSFAVRDGFEVSHLLTRERTHRVSADTRRRRLWYFVHDDD